MTGFDSKRQMAQDKEALKLALEAMEYADACLKKQLTTKTKHEYAQDLLLSAGNAVKEALAQPAQEPVGKFAKFTDGVWREVTNGSAGVPLYTTPPQRPWVGLTEEERDYIALGIEVSVTEILLEAEAKLKEKNNGSR